jgi:hypothetical protein
VLIGNRPLNEDGEGTIGSQGTGTVAKGKTERPAPSGVQLEQAVVKARGDRVTIVKVRAGDQLPLTVRVSRADQVEIPALGLLRAAFPNAPARFDLLLPERGSYGVSLVRADRVVARIEVAPRAKKSPAKAAQPDEAASGGG